MTSLRGVRVVVTRSAGDSDTLASLLEAKGAEAIRLPTIAIEFPDELLEATTAVAEALQSGDYDWVVFSSRPGVTALNHVLERRGIDLDVFESVKVAAVGSATCAAFEDAAGRPPDLVPPRFTGADLAASLGSGRGRVLLPRPLDAHHSIIEELSARGWDPEEVPLYRTTRGDPPSELVDRVRTGDFDVLTFTSGSTVRFFVEIVGDIAQEPHRVVVIGPSTQAVARELGFHVDAVAEPHTTKGLVSAVERVVGR